MNKRNVRICTVVLVAAALLTLPAPAQVKNHRDLKFPKLPEFKIPRPEVHTLDNGMKIFLMVDSELPLISVSARIRGGSDHEPEDKAGLAGIFAQAMREGGTTSMSGDEIDDFLAARAAFVETGMTGDFGTASMNCLKDDFDDVLAVFADVLRSPVFDEEKIDLARRQAKTGIARRNDDIGQIANREFRRLIYGPESALSRMVEYATVDAVTRDDLLAWHARHYHPNNVYLGVVGDFDSAKMRDKLQEVFKDWPRGAAIEQTEVPYGSVPPGTYFVEKTDVTQAYVRLGHLGIEAKNPDYFAVQVMNEVFGGGFAARLFSNVRSEKGLAYSVGGGIGSSFVRPGMFRVALSTKSGTMGESVDALKEEIDAIINKPPTKDEMQRAKEAILNSFVFNYASRGQVLNQQMTYAYYGMPEDFLEQYRRNIEKVTGEDVIRVAKKYIHPDALVLLVVGKAEDFDRPVSSFGEVTEIDISIPPPADSAPELVKSAANIEAGAALLQRAVHAIAGDSPRLESMRLGLTVAVSLGEQSMTVNQSVSIVLPDKIHQTLRMPMGERTMVINGDRGAVSMGGQSQPIPAEQISEGVRDLGRELLVLASHIDSPELEAVAAGSEEVDGTPCEIVAVSFRGAESRLFVGADGMVLKQAYQGKHPLQGTPGHIDVRFSDYREVDGRMIPHKRVVSFEGQEVLSASLDSIEINSPIDSALFEVPVSE